MRVATILHESRFASERKINEKARIGKCGRDVPYTASDLVHDTIFELF